MHHSVPKVSFVAQLVALGDAKVIAEELSALGSTPILVFTATVEEVRKAGSLYRRKVKLTEGGEP